MLQGERHHGSNYSRRLRAAFPEWLFAPLDWGKSKLKTEAHLTTGVGLQLFIRHFADIVIVDLHGRATIGRANDFFDSQLQQLIEVGTSKILVNLTDATQFDSSSIGSIVRASTSLKHRGASLKLLAPRGNVRLVLEAVHLQDLIPTIEDETQAISSFQDTCALTH
jgi:anti-anti-sigma factor